MKKILLVCLLVLGVVLAQPMVQSSLVHAEDEETAIKNQIDELQHLMNLSTAATTPLEGQVLDLDKKIKSAQAGIKSAKNGTALLAADIIVREGELGQYYNLLKARVQSEYVQFRRQSILDFFLQTKTARLVFQKLAYHEMLRNQNQVLIMNVEQRILQLEADKKSLEEKQARLAALQTQLDKQAEFFKGEISKAKAYQKDLSGKIAELTARQQEIINARNGGFTFSGDSELADDPLASIAGFRASAPGGYFAVFSFGAYSHRNGMSQYGALGRAKSGQDAKTILAAYYPGSSIKEGYSEMSEISVSGNGSGSFEDWYLQRIYEVPASWPKEVLKAQAIAARTYAIRYTDNGKKSICTSEKCQVFKNSPKGGAWEEAVRETRGMVLVDGGGNPVSTQFASTHGGWSKTSGWDTTDGQGGSNFIEKAYEKIGGSPWLYKSWWRKGYSRDGETCGRSNPWLSPEEMADIVNAHLVLKNGSGGETERITPVSTSCWRGSPYSMGELRDVASRYRGISSASSVSVSQGNGRTNTVTINGVSMSGDDFCMAFTLRAPGYLRIPQWSGSSCGGSFFNIEHKN